MNQNIHDQIYLELSDRRLLNDIDVDLHDEIIHAVYCAAHGMRSSVDRLRLADKIERYGSVQLHGFSTQTPLTNDERLEIIAALRGASPLSHADLAPGVCWACQGRGEVGKFDSAENGYRTERCQSCDGRGSM